MYTTKFADRTQLDNAEIPANSTNKVFLGQASNAVQPSNVPPIPPKPAITLNPPKSYCELLKEFENQKTENKMLKRKNYEQAQSLANVQIQNMNLQGYNSFIQSQIQQKQQTDTSYYEERCNSLAEQLRAAQHRAALAGAEVSELKLNEIRKLNDANKQLQIESQKDKQTIAQLEVELKKAQESNSDKTDQSHIIASLREEVKKEQGANSILQLELEVSKKMLDTAKKMYSLSQELISNLQHPANSNQVSPPRNKKEKNAVNLLQSGFFKPVNGDISNASDNNNAQKDPNDDEKVEHTNKKFKQ